jgi:ABC-type transport system substrate-binding protein
LTYISQENGLRIRYPQGWTTQAPAQGEQSLVVFLSPDKSVQSDLYVFPAQSGDTAESAIGQLAGSALQGLQNISIVSDAALTRTDAASAWSRVVTADSSGTGLKINLTSLIFGAREFFLMTYGMVTGYDANAKGLDSLLNGISFEAPVVNGVNRNQALFLTGGESTNARDYDPATQHDSGDKRIFSGLVSFDTNLNLTPELAESWDISADGKCSMSIPSRSQLTRASRTSCSN